MSILGAVRGGIRGGVRSGVAPPLAEDSGGVTVYLLDTFTDTNGTLLTAHTMNVGSGWTGSGSQFFDIQGNATREQFGAAGSVAANAGVANGVYRCTVSAAGGFFALRVTDSDNMVFVANSTSTSLEVFRRQAGANTSVNSAVVSTITYPAQIQITLSGNTITALVLAQSGQTVSGSEAFNNTATSHGFRAQTALITYDDFSFQSA